VNRVSGAAVAVLCFVVVSLLLRHLSFSSSLVWHMMASHHNTSSAAARTVAEHYSRRGEAGLVARRQSNILHLRNFNNFVKSTLLSTYIARVRAAAAMVVPGPRRPHA